MSFRVLYSCFRADLEVTDRHSVQFRGPAGKVLLTIRGRVQVYEGPTRGFSYGRVAGRVRARVWHDCRQAQGSYGISGRVEVRSLSEVPMESKFSGLFGGPATVSPCREVGMQAIWQMRSRNFGNAFESAHAISGSEGRKEPDS